MRRTPHYVHSEGDGRSYLGAYADGDTPILYASMSYWLETSHIGLDGEYEDWEDHAE